MKPIVKYRGGKSKEIAKFLDYIPNQFDTYFEPFFGGGAVFFYLAPRKAIINDANERLMNFYKEVKNNYLEVRKQLNKLQVIYESNQNEYSRLKKNNPKIRVPNNNEDLYYKIRDMYNHKIPEEYSDAVIYYFINKTAYSGMIRYNSHGEYNVPFGRYKNFNTQLLTEEHHNSLQQTDLLTGDFTVPFKMAKKNDFMFLDPPYDCIFNDYGNLESKNGFDESEHCRLAAEFKKLKCKALMVIGKTPLTVDLYKDYIKDEYFKSYAVNIRNRFKSETKHLIVTNY